MRLALLTQRLWRYYPRLLAVGGLTVLGATLRLYHLDYFSFWLDETISYEWSLPSLGSILFELQLHPDQMFLTWLISHLLIGLHLGDTIWQLRLPSALFGTATIPTMWLLGRALFGGFVGLIAALLTALWPVLIIYSQEYRGYALEVLLASLALYAVVRGCQTNQPGWWALLSITLIMYLYNHMTSIVYASSLVVAVVLWLALDALRANRAQHVPIRSRFFSFVALSGIVASGYLPGFMLLANFLDKTRSSSNIAVVKTSLAWNSATFVTVFGDFLGLGAGWPLVVTAGLAAIGLGWSLRTHPHAAATAVAWLGTPLLAFGVLSGGGSVLTADRYLLSLTPMYLVLVAAGIAALAPAVWAVMRPHRVADVARITLPGVALLAVLATTAVVLVHTFEVNPKQVPVDLKTAYQYVLDRARPGDLIVETSNTATMPTFWFSRYDEYFLRPRVRPAGIFVARFGSAEDRPGYVCLTLTIPDVEIACVDHAGVTDGVRVQALPGEIGGLSPAHGRVWVLATTSEVDVPSLREAVGHGRDMNCYEGICVVAPDAAGSDLLSQLSSDLRKLAPLAT